MQGLQLTKYGGTLDPFRGLHLKQLVHADIQELSQFLTLVEESKEVRSVWAYITITDIPVLDLLANKHNYELHRAKGKDIVLIKWLSNRASLIPPYSLFIVAAGALLVHQGKVLLVQEKGGTRAGKFGLPGGRMDAHEMVHVCVERQLLEQTGIRAKFRRVVYLRESTHQLYDSVDLYFVCLMDVTQEGLTSLKICDRQIKDYKWVPLEEYQAFTKENSMGTQNLVAVEVTRLHRQGRLLDEKSYKFQLQPSKRCQHTF